MPNPFLATTPPVTALSGSPDVAGVKSVTTASFDIAALVPVLVVAGLGIGWIVFLGRFIVRMPKIASGPRVRSVEGLRGLLHVMLISFAIYLLSPFIVGSLMASPGSDGTLQLDDRQRVLAMMWVYALTLLGVRVAWLARVGGRRPGAERGLTIDSGVSVGLMPMMGPRDLRAVLLWSIIAIPATYLISVASVRLWKAMAIDHAPAHDLLQLMGRSGVSPELIGAILSAAVLAPVVEEVLFRGLLQTAVASLATALFLRPSSSDPRLSVPSTFGGVSRAGWVGIVMSSLLFASIHAWWTMPAIFVLSIVMGWSYERSGRLWVPIGVHVLFNSISTLIYLLTALR
jgi:membrane protease YdiL (CAAX protease family)